MPLPGFGDGGSYNTLIIIVMVVFTTFLYIFQLNSSNLGIAKGVQTCEKDNWWPLANSIFMVVAALITTALNQVMGASIGSDIIEH